MSSCEFSGFVGFLAGGFVAPRFSAMPGEMGEGVGVGEGRKGENKEEGEEEEEVELENKFSASVLANRQSATRAEATPAR